MGRLRMKSFNSLFLDFGDLIEDFSFEFEMLLPAKDEPTQKRDDLGKPIKTTAPATVIGRGALIPLPQRTIYESGGRLTESDRQLYSLDHNIPPKTKIFHEGVTYHVEGKTPYTPYSDFSLYILKGVNAFD